MKTFEEAQTKTDVVRESNKDRTNILDAYFRGAPLQVQSGSQ